MGQKPEVLVDTDILIKVFRGSKSHKLAIDKLGNKACLSVVTVCELYFGCKTDVRINQLTLQLEAYNIININDHISSEAVRLIIMHNKSKSMKLGDSFIAATALHYNLELFTDNKKDFEIIDGLNFFRP